MKRFVKATTSLSVVLMLFVATCFTNVSAATGTGYTKAGDVDYSKYTYSGKIANWGARGEDCVFLTSKAIAFYTGENTFDKLSKIKGGTNKNDVASSYLYDTLQGFMSEKHTYKTNYDEMRYNMYNYTDCIMGNTGMISCFYSGKAIGPNWDSGSTWNREHTWPQSKGSNKSTPAGSDIMAVRPTASSANGSRGNKAYGESSACYDPNTKTSYNLRGDCARIMLYTYVRWGTSAHIANAWGTDGVMESVEIMLKWMQEDPVDTWEMGRNDSVQSITGTRNVFVDYPEFAWLLFSKSVPKNMTTPSGEAKNGVTGGTENGGSTGSNTGNNTSSSTSSSISTGNSTSSKNDTVTSSNGTSSADTSSSTSGVGGIDNKPQNEGKPFDPSNLGGTTTLVEDEGSTFSAWMIIVPVAVVLAAVIAVAVVIIIRQKKVK